MKAKDLIKYLQATMKSGEEDVMLWEWNKGDERLIDISLPCEGQIFKSVAADDNYEYLTLTLNYMYTLRKGQFTLSRKA